jgi:ATP-dependent Lhr-like helicase
VIEPLLEQARNQPLGEEALEKTIHDRHDPAHARQVLEGIANGSIEIHATPPGTWTDLPLARLKWRELPDVPPPTLLKAVGDRLRQEEQTLVCLRCGFQRTITPARYVAAGGSLCGLCGGSLSAVLSPRRPQEIAQVVAYAKRKWKGRKVARVPRAPSATLTPLIRTAYTSAELLATYGEKALLCLAARGVGPDTARRLLARLYRSDAELMTEILRAERSYARTRAFWD